MAAHDPGNAGEVAEFLAEKLFGIFCIFPKSRSG